MLNVLHFLAAGSVAACLYVQRQGAPGRRQSRGWLLVPPILAFVCAYVMMGLTAPVDREPHLLRAAAAAGAIVGIVRGAFMVVVVDQWSRVNLPTGRDGLLIGCAIAMLVALATAAPMVFPAAIVWLSSVTAAVALSAGFLAGRAAVIYLRSRG